MIKKLLFLPVCLTLIFSPFAQPQQTIKDLGYLTEIIKQLPEEELALVEHALLEKAEGNSLLGTIAFWTCAAIGTTIIAWGEYRYQKIEMEPIIEIHKNIAKLLTEGT